MSLTNLNNNIYPLTLDGLQTAYLDSLYINNNLVVPGNYIPYTGAVLPVDLNNQSISSKKRKHLLKCFSRMFRGSDELD